MADETTVDQINENVTKFIEQTNNRIQELKNQVDEGNKTFDEAKQEYDKVLNAQQDALKDAQEQIKQLSKRNIRNSDDLIRPEGVSKHMDELTPAQLMVAHGLASDGKNMSLKNNVEAALSKVAEATPEDIENHFASVLANSHVASLPKTDARRRFMENTLNSHLQYALASGDGGTVGVPGAEIFEYLTQEGVLFPRIPVEPRLAESGSVVSAAPFGAGTLTFTRGGGGNVGEDGITPATNLELNAFEGTVGVRVSDSYIEDYSFGDAVMDIMASAMRDAGPRIDSLVAYGDDTSGNTNFNGSRGDWFAELRKFAGFGKNANAGTSVAPTGDSSLNVDLFNDAMGVMGQRFGGNPSNVVLVGSLRQLIKLSKSTGIGDLTVVEGDTVRVGKVMSMLGVDLTPVDYGAGLNDRAAANGRVVANAAANKDIAILANTMSMKGGFHRGFNVSRRQISNAMASMLIFNFRWAQNVQPEADSAVLIRNLAD